MYSRILTDFFADFACPLRADFTPPLQISLIPLVDLIPFSRFLLFALVDFIQLGSSQIPLVDFC